MINLHNWLNNLVESFTFYGGGSGGGREPSGSGRAGGAGGGGLLALTRKIRGPREA